MRVNLFMLVVTAALVPSASAQFGFAARASTMGFGADVSYAVQPKLNVRLGGSYFTYTTSDVITQDDISVQYDADATLGSAQAIADFFPFRNLFRLSGGVMLNLNEANGRVFAVEPYTLNQGQPNEKTFSPERVGSLSAVMGYQSKLSPYFGLGLGNPTKGGIGFELEIGALYAGRPKIEMTGTGLIGPTADQAPRLQEGTQSFRLYPMVSLGLSFGTGK